MVTMSVRKDFTEDSIPAMFGLGHVGWQKWLGSDETREMPEKQWVRMTGKAWSRDS
jgi:hypothetical protein